MQQQYILNSYNRRLYCGIILIFMFLIISSNLPLSAETAVKDSLNTLKKEVFSWLFAVKVASVAVGSVFAVAKQSLMPFGIGAGIAVGIQVFDKVIGEASGALI